MLTTVRFYAKDCPVLCCIVIRREANRKPISYAVLGLSEGPVPVGCWISSQSTESQKLVASEW